MRDHHLFPRALGGGPDRFGAQRRLGEPGEAVEYRELGARRARHAIARNGGDARRRAGHQRGEAGRGLRWKSGNDVVGNRAAFDQLGEIGQFPLPRHFQREGGNGAVPGEDDRFARVLAEDRARLAVKRDRDRDQQDEKRTAARDHHWENSAVAGKRPDDCVTAPCAALRQGSSSPCTYRFWAAVAAWCRPRRATVKLCPCLWR